MSVICLAVENNIEIPVGTKIVIDETSKLARAFEQGVDDIWKVVGVAYPKTGTSGRIVANVDGYAFLDKDYYTFDEALQLTYTPNLNYAPFDPVNSTDPVYCFVAVTGMVAILKNNEDIPVHWSRIREGVVYDIMIIH